MWKLRNGWSLSSHLDDDHVDDSEVLEVRVLFELLPELPPTAFHADRHLVAVDHRRHEPPPGLVQRANTDSGFLVVDRQERFDLEGEWNKA